MKTCSKCKIFKEAAAFCKGNNRDGLTSQCKQCVNEYRQTNKEKVKDSNLRCDYGISLETYNQMLIDQNHCCKTCDRHISLLTKVLAVDHDHKTGEVRGLLCDFCNRQLGVYENKPELFKNFDVYLSKGEIMKK